MADLSNRSRRSSGPDRRSDLIRCDNCGEYYSVTYKRCPFCDERPERPGQPGGRRVATNKRGGGYGGAVNPVQIALLILSFVLVVAAAFIVIKAVAPLFHRDPAADPGGSSVSTSQGGTSASSPDVSTPAGSMTLDRTELSLAAGESAVLTVTLPDGAQGEVTWSSSNTGIAAVDAGGTVTNTNGGSSAANAVITAAWGDQSVSCTVTCAGSGSTVVTPEPAPSGGTIAPNTLCVVTNAEGGLRIRSGPGTSYDVLVSTQNGAYVTVLEDAGDGWYKIQYTVTGGKSAVGYLKHEYVTPK